MTRRPTGLTVIVGEEVKTADGDLICVFLERADPARAVRRRDRSRPRASRAGSSGFRIRSIGCAGRSRERRSSPAIAPLVDWVEVHNARLLGKGNEQAAAFAHEHGLPGVAVSDAHSILEVGVAYTALDGDPSTPAGLLAAPAGGRARAGPRELRRPARRRRSPRSSSALRGNGRIQPGASGEPTGRPERRTGPSADGGCDRPTVASDADGGHPRHRPARPRAARPAVAAPRPAAGAGPRRREASPTPSRCRSRDGCGSRGRSSRSPSRSRSSPPSSASTARRSRRSRGSSSPRTRRSSCWPSSSSTPGFPLRGLRWAILLRGTGFRIGVEGLDRDHLPVLAGQLRRAGQARRRLSRLPAQDQQHGVAEPDVRHGLHRARARPLRDRAARDRGRLLELPRRPAAGDPDRVRHRRRGRRRPGHRPVHDAQLRAADHRRAAVPAAHQSSSCTTASRRASSGRWSRASCRPWRPDRRSSG